MQVLDAMAKRTRGNDLPMGGIQLILCGDFYQLPPVNKHTPAPTHTSMSAYTQLLTQAHTQTHTQSSPRYCFQSHVWSTLVCPQHSYVLTHIFRQHTDHVFAHILSRVRTGTLTHEDGVCLQTCYERYEQAEGCYGDDGDILPTSIHTHK
jgi:ATP-dependent DNA helicase PIF1